MVRGNYGEFRFEKLGSKPQGLRRGGKKLHVFWEKLRVFEREFLAGFFRAKNTAFREKNKRAFLDHFSRKQAAQATKSR